MVAVFAIFATLSTLDMKQMGFGLAVALLMGAAGEKVPEAPAVPAVD